MSVCAHSSNKQLKSLTPTSVAISFIVETKVPAQHKRYDLEVPFSIFAACQPLY